MPVPLLFFLLLGLGIPQQDEVLDRAINHYENGEYTEAASLLTSSGDTSDISAEVKFWLGKSYRKLRQWDKSVQAFEKAVEMEPSNPLYHLWLGHAYGARAENRFFGFNDARRLLKEFKNAAKLDPDSITIRFDLLEFYVQAPGIVGGSKNKARLEAERISKLNPLRGYIARATIHEQEKKWDMAKKDLTQATVDFPKEADTHKDLAQFLFNRKDYEGALKSAREALELDAISKRSRILEAASRIQLGTCLDETAKNLQDLASGSSRDGDPTFEEVYYWIGVCQFKRGAKEKARNAFESALTYNPDDKKTKKYLDDLK